MTRIKTMINYIYKVLYRLKVEAKGASMERVKGERAKRLLKVSFRNLGTVNQNEVRIETENGHLVITFSYQTPVGYSIYIPGKLRQEIVRQNDWSRTTGKLLNDLEPDKKARVTGEVFEKALEKALEQILRK